jgi:hypothetical protein
MMSRRFLQMAFGGLAIVLLASVFVLRQAPTAEPQTAGTAPAAAVPLDAVVRLQQKIDGGEVTLEFAGERGYLSSVLKALDIPVSSQVLVFAKSSAQMSGISPTRPRALYFNDEVYVGWVQEGALELAVVDPASGPFFYTLTQEGTVTPRFERHTSNCVGCHDSSEDPARLIPRLLKLSVLPDREGRAIQSAALATIDRSPFRERWGGWYVTGTHGRQIHMGNQMFRAPNGDFGSIPEYIANVDLTPGANVTDLRKRFDTTRYLTPHSDIVALMVLGHQTHVSNVIAVAIHKLAAALEVSPSLDTTSLTRMVGEPIVRAMLFSGEAVLTDPVAGTSGFADEFPKRGPRDRQGRSLRDLDLNKRLLRYPLSYMIYSASFDAMPAGVKQYVYARFRDVLNGSDQSPAFANLSPADREAILGILQDTKPDFAAVTAK